METRPTMPPPSFRLTPYLTVHDGASAWYERALGAARVYEMLADDGVRYLHAHLRVKGCSVFI